MAAINVIACDPGSTGSMCLLKLDPATQPEIEFIENEAPLLTRHAWLSDLAAAGTVRISMIEEVHSVFGASAKSNFTFGGNVREGEVLLKLQPFGLDYVQPKEWQKFIGVKPRKKGIKRPAGELKKEIAAIAETLYPGCDIRGPQGGLKDGRSDALMIAHFCAMKYK